MYHHILIPIAPNHYDEYAVAFSVAHKLLGSGGKITALSVVEELPTYTEAYITREQMEKNKAEVSVDLKTRFKDEGVDTHVMFGHAANSILEWAEQNDVDCIVVSSHRPGLADYFIGSTAARIVRHSKCPVHVLR